jgi:hypothetical protein
MMEHTEFEIFTAILDMSAKKHGSAFVLTLGHLCNIAEMAGRIFRKMGNEQDKKVQENLEEYWDEAYRYGSGNTEEG